MIASNVPGVAFDGVDKGGVEVDPTRELRRFLGATILTKNCTWLADLCHLLFEKTQESTCKHRMQTHLHGLNACGMRGANAMLFR